MGKEVRMLRANLRDALHLAIAEQKKIDKGRYPGEAEFNSAFRAGLEEILGAINRGDTIKISEV